MHFDLSTVSVTVYQESRVQRRWTRYQGRPQDSDIAVGVTSHTDHWGVLNGENWLYFLNQHTQIKARYEQISFLINI